MPVPYDIECNESMSAVYSSKADIVEAIDKIKGLATDETWEGTPAETWMTDLRGHLTDALNALGDPLDTAVAECHKHAQELKAKSARAAAGST